MNFIKYHSHFLFYDYDNIWNTFFTEHLRATASETANEYEKLRSSDRVSKEYWNLQKNFYEFLHISENISTAYY